jgi:hypothetical protein
MEFTMSMKKTLSILLLAAAGLAAGLAAGTRAQAEPQSGVKAGTMTCDVASGWGVIIGSSRELNCIYRPVNGSAERYTGRITKFGVDVGYTSGGIIVWGVLAPTSDMSPGALAGNYAGATAGVTLGVGAGAHVLIGGLKKSVALQPVSIEGNSGLNVAAGVASLSLTHTQVE